MMKDNMLKLSSPLLSILKSIIIKEVNLDLPKLRVFRNYLIFLNSIVFMIYISPPLNAIYPSGYNLLKIWKNTQNVRDLGKVPKIVFSNLMTVPS